MNPAHYVRHPERTCLAILHTQAENIAHEQLRAHFFLMARGFLRKKDEEAKQVVDELFQDPFIIQTQRQMTRGILAGMISIGARRAEWKQ